jgi:hypothetical protein
VEQSGRRILQQDQLELQETLLPVDSQSAAMHLTSSPYAFQGYPWFSPLAPCLMLGTKCMQIFVTKHANGRPV